jgi:AraC-like DNA-binding protein
VNHTSSSLKTAFERSFATRKDDGFRHLGGRMVTAGCETRTVPAEYRWHGLQRGESAEHPRITFQATLSGRGNFERNSRTWEVGAGQAFFCAMPSRHVYYLPAESPEWTFFWFHFGHPYVVQRIIALAKRHPPVFNLTLGTDFLAQSLSFFERICRQRFEDAFEEENALFEWMLSFERHLHNAAYPQAQKKALLDDVRDFTLANLRRSFGIEEIAKHTGMSRSHYCHRFKTATGLAPAAYVLEVRLAEARKQLRKSHAPLKEIAAATGFADDNHLCKAFRRQYNLSPGAYRRHA